MDTERIVWAEVLAEAETFTGGLAEYVSEHSSRPGHRVMDENGSDVTVNAWATKLSIPQKTLDRWVQKARSNGTLVGPAPESIARKQRYMKQGAKEALRDPEAAAEILSDPQVRQNVLRALTPTPTERAARSRALSEAHEAYQPLRGAVGRVVINPSIELLQEGLAGIQQAVSNDAVFTEDEVEELRTICQGLDMEIEVLTSRKEGVSVGDIA